MKTIEVEVQAEQEIAAAWHEYQEVEWHGLEFGRICCEWRAKLKTKGGIGNKNRGIIPTLEQLNIPKSTAYYWMDRYEESIGIKHPEIKPDSSSVHFSSDSAEWYTPPEIVERTLQVLGSIDLDPCCNPGEPTIPANNVFRKDDNGLDQLWHGKVYMNPPYGDAIGEWVQKLMHEYAFGITQEAIALVPARVDTQWFKNFRDFPICFISGRLKFSNCDNSAPFPSAVVYIGKDYAKFYNAFKDIGDIWIRFRGNGESA